MNPFDAFGEAPRFLPAWLLEMNLLQWFIWYLSIMFLISLCLRLYFYHAVFLIARHVRLQCPRIFALINEHWFLCLRNGLVTWFLLYLSLLAPYMILSQFVWPSAVITFSQLADLNPALVALILTLAGLMLALDLQLLAQVSVIDAERIQSDLTWSEQWLGGGLNRLLENLGQWNPIKRYADKVTLENIGWLNRVFRTGIWSMCVQLALRLSLAVSLYACYLLHP